MNKILQPIQKFIQLEAFSGILLALCTCIAMLLANSRINEFYFQILTTKIFHLSIHHWINDGLMVIFFFVVGMEIKKELLVGELSSRKKAALPIAAAIGGMIFPALIYFLFNPEYPSSKGWGIPMATDIAFALAVLSFFRVPLALKVFLLALAIVDDLGAVLVIALFYTKEIHMIPLLAAASLLAIIEILKKLKISAYFAYVILGIGIWLGLLLSGVHATIAGVLLGFFTPINFEKNGVNYSPINELIQKLHPIVTYFIMPLFALTNAGVAIEEINLSLISNPIHLGIVLGLLVGKPIGIFALSFLAVKIKLAELPAGVGWTSIFAIGLLGGIGFTMALFISELALYPEQGIFSKTGILLGSLLATLFGSIFLKLAIKKAIR